MSFITIGILECPACKTICTGHVITEKEISQTEWTNTHFVARDESIRAGS
jgi:hypothetical protein